MVKLAYWLLSVVAFFTVFKVWGIYPATILVMALAVMDVVWAALAQRDVSRNSWIGLVIILALGAETLIFRDPIFIKWSPTSFYGLAAATLLTSLLLRKSIIRAAQPMGRSS